MGPRPNESLPGDPVLYASRSRRALQEARRALTRYRVPLMPWRSRSLLLALLSVGYVLVAAMRSSGGREWGLLVLLALPPLLLVAWTRTEPPSRGEDWVSPVTRSATRAAAFGGALLAASWVAPGG